MPFKMLVYLEIRGRRVILDKRGTEVPTEDRKSFRHGTKHPYSKGMRPLLWEGQTGVEMGAEHHVVGLNVFHEEGELMAPVEE